MKISLVVTTYNRPDALNLVLKSIAQQSIKPFEVIIADDGSTEETNNAIENFRRSYDINLVHSWQKDKGFRASRSRNKAIAKSVGDYIVLVDGDMILDQYFVEDHMKYSEEGFFIQGSRVFLSKELTSKVLSHNRINFNFYQKGLSNRKNAIRSRLLSNIFSNIGNDISGVKTCNMSFFKHDFYSVNGFNNSFQGWGREDSEFVVRLKNNGINRKNIRFSAIQYHLWHSMENRKSLVENDKLLERAIKEKLKWCESGVSEF